MEDRKEFTFRESWWKAIESLPRGIQGEVLTAVVRYGLYGETTENLKPIARAIVELIISQIDDNLHSPRKGCPKGKVNNPDGRRGKRTDSELNNADSELKEELNKTNSELIPDLINSKEKEKKQEKESFPPDPLYKEKEIKKEKETTPKPPEGAGGGGGWRENLKASFFSRQSAIEGFCMTNHTTAEKLRRLVESIFDDWELSHETDLSERHLLNSLRRKLKIERDETNKPLKDDRLTGRRGTEPDVPGRQDYSDTL